MNLYKCKKKSYIVVISMFVAFFNKLCYNIVIKNEQKKTRYWRTSSVNPTKKDSKIRCLIYNYNNILNLYSQFYTKLNFISKIVLVEINLFSVRKEVKN